MTDIGTKGMMDESCFLDDMLVGLLGNEKTCRIDLNQIIIF